MSRRGTVLMVLVFLLATISLFAFAFYLYFKVSFWLGACVFVLLIRALSQFNSDEFSYLSKRQRVPYLLLLPSLATTIGFLFYAAWRKWWFVGLLGLGAGVVLNAILTPRLLPRLQVYRRVTKLLEEADSDSSFDESFDQYARALFLAREVADYKLQARSVAGMGQVRRKQGRTREALALFRGAVRVMSSGEIPARDEFRRSVFKTIGELLIGEGDRRMQLGRRGAAREYYEEAEDFLSRVVDSGPLLYKGTIGADPDPLGNESRRIRNQIEDWQDRVSAADEPLEDVAAAASERVTGPSFRDHFVSSQGELREVERPEPIDCTVFAPPTAPQGEAFLVQLFAHMPEQVTTARALASEFSEAAQRRGYKSLGTEIFRGTTLTFVLVMPGLEVDEPVQSLIWSGRPESVQFGVTVPPGRNTGRLIGTVAASVNSVPVGHIKFEFTVTAANSERTEIDLEPVGDEARGYAMAFCSYASEDRDEVIRRVQMLTALGIRYFQDILDLDPGDRWQQKLYQHIDECDLFLLFWSTNARESEWVRRETDYALMRKGDDPFAPPEIRPIIIEGPPVVRPWEELSDLHFNDRLIYVLQGD
jgi:tetratricopeptide (TPR) repeat protein